MPQVGAQTRLLVCEFAGGDELKLSEDVQVICMTMKIDFMERDELIRFPGSDSS